MNIAIEQVAGAVSGGPLVREMRIASIGIAAVLCGGCSRSPTISLLGSFFPSWLFCAVLGVVLAFVTRALCRRTGWDSQLPAPALFYLACAGVFTLGAYLVWLT